ncbi:MAG: pyridoxal phosphate-dependent aminotransferase [Gammaproteobacteria bacterium]|nr:pyridoxal phosphate-dependent aminotransferase [Gammaproteobacteria bacterium]
MQTMKKSSKLDDVCYEIRGPVMELAAKMERQGHQILKLNIGNPAPFGLAAPDEIIQDLIRNAPDTSGYSDSKGLFPARKAVMQYYQGRGIGSMDVSDIYLGNGVSELIVMLMQALINNGDEVLIPAPDYPLWTAAVSLAGGKAVHYRCDEADDWNPVIEDMAAKITDRTKGIVLINPNNPTGALYSDDTLRAIAELAKQHGLPVFADEIYDKVLYDGVTHTPMASLCAPEQLCISFGGLSKNYRAAGFRAGWMALSGEKKHAQDFIAGLNMLAAMRLCANVPGQSVIQTALGGYQSINDLVLPTGRLGKQRDLAWSRINQIEGLSCVKPKGAMYLFPKLEPGVFTFRSDIEFARLFLEEEKVLLVQGSGFNIDDSNHFRIVFLPDVDRLTTALDRLERFLDRYRA